MRIAFFAALLLAPLPAFAGWHAQYRTFSDGAEKKDRTVVWCDGRTYYEQHRPDLAQYFDLREGTLTVAGAGMSAPWVEELPALFQRLADTDRDAARKPDKDAAQPARLRALFDAQTAKAREEQAAAVPRATGRTLAVAGRKCEVHAFQLWDRRGDLAKIEACIDTTAPLEGADRAAAALMKKIVALGGRETSQWWVLGTHMLLPYGLLVRLQVDGRDELVLEKFETAPVPKGLLEPPAKGRK